MTSRIGASQTPQSEPDRSQPSDGDLPFPFSGASEKVSFQLIPQWLLENVRQRLVLRDSLDEAFCCHRHWPCIVGIDQPLDDLNPVLAGDVDAAFPGNEQCRDAFPGSGEFDRLTPASQDPVPSKHGPEFVCDERDFRLFTVDLIGKRRQNVSCQTRSRGVAGLQNQSDTEIVARAKLSIDGRPDLFPVEATREVDRNIAAIDTQCSEVEEMVSQLFDSGRIERLFKAFLQVLSNPVVAHRDCQEFRVWAGG